MAGAHRKTGGVPSSRRGRQHVKERRVLVVGEARKLAPVVRALGKLDARVERTPWARCQAEAQRADVLAVVLMAPLAEIDLQEAVHRLTEGPPAGGVSTIVLLDVPETHGSVRALYRAGATAVLRWPRKPGELAAVLAEVLGIAWVRGPARRIDVALARTVRANLRLFGGTTPGLRVSVSEGVVHLGGTVPSLKRKQDVIRVVSAVAGVTAADATALHVIPNRRVPDRQVRESVAALIRAVSEHGTPNVTVAVQRGHVRLSGELQNRRDLARIEELVSSVRGVRSITTRIAFSRRPSVPDHVVRARLQARLQAAFPDEDLTVSVFSGVAVVTGRVQRLSTKQGAERLVREDEGVKRALVAVQVA